MASSAAVDTTSSAATPFTIGPSNLIPRLFPSSSQHLQSTFNAICCGPCDTPPVMADQSPLGFNHAIYFSMLLKHVLSEIVEFLQSIIRKSLWYPPSSGRTREGNHTIVIVAFVDHPSRDMNSKSDVDRSKITPSPQHTRAMTARGSTCFSLQGTDSKSRTRVPPSTQRTRLHDKTTQTLVRLLSRDMGSKGSKGRTRHTRPPNSTQRIFPHVETTTVRVTTMLSRSDTRHRRHLVASTKIASTRHHSI
jgi:hypothetical protein